MVTIPADVARAWARIRVDHVVIELESGLAFRLVLTPVSGQAIAVSTSGGTEDDATPHPKP